VPDVRVLRARLNLFGGQKLFYPPRAHDSPTVTPADALHPHDGAGNPFNLDRYPGVTPVELLVRFTDVLSIVNPTHFVDRLAWVVLFNCVPLISQGPGRNPPMSGYDITVVDAKTGLAIIGLQSGPPLTAAQIGY
jgi:hypothetical protein